METTPHGLKLDAVLSDEAINRSKTPAVFPLGLRPKGYYFQLDISKSGTLLVYGSSGTGKTAFARSVVAYLAARWTPDDVQFLLLDSKRVDYQDLRLLPHVMYHSDGLHPDSVVFEWLLIEAKKRLKCFSEAAARDLASYNRKVTEKKLPALFVVIDDASAILSGDLELDSLLQKCRIAGIYLIFITSSIAPKSVLESISQRTENKLCFSAKRADSKALLGNYDAAALAIPGEAIFASRLDYAPVEAFDIEESEISRVVEEQMGEEPDKSSGDSLRDYLEKNAVKSSPRQEYFDEMLPQAVDVAVEMGSCSVSMLQRSLKLGYARCARMIDQMEELGIVGPYEGAKPRSVTIDRAGWEQLKRVLEGGSETAEQSDDDEDSSCSGITFYDYYISQTSPVTPQEFIRSIQELEQFLKQKGLEGDLSEMDYDDTAEAFDVVSGDRMFKLFHQGKYYQYLLLLKIYMEFLDIYDSQES